MRRSVNFNTASAIIERTEWNKNMIIGDHYSTTGS